MLRADCWDDCWAVQWAGQRAVPKGDERAAMMVVCLVERKADMRDVSRAVRWDAKMVE